MLISKRSMLSMKLFVFGIALSGCSDEIKPPRTTGVLAIQLTTEPNVCTEPCADGRYVVAHSELRFSASAVGENAKAPLKARSFDGLAATVVEQTTKCVCKVPGGGANISIAEDASCESLVKDCSYEFVVRTNDAGDATIVVETPSGRAIDAAALRVREVASLSPRFALERERALRSGRHLFRRGDDITVYADPKDSEGYALFHQEPPRLTSSDDRVAAPDAMTAGSGKAVGVGTATLTVSLGGASSGIDIEVVPP